MGKKMLIVPLSCALSQGGEGVRVWIIWAPKSSRFALARVVQKVIFTHY